MNIWHDWSAVSAPTASSSLHTNRYTNPHTHPLFYPGKLRLAVLNSHRLVAPSSSGLGFGATYCLTRAPTPYICSSEQKQTFYLHFLLHWFKICDAFGREHSLTGQMFFWRQPELKIIQSSFPKWKFMSSADRYQLTRGIKHSTTSCHLFISLCIYEEGCDHLMMFIVTPQFK